MVNLGSPRFRIIRGEHEACLTMDNKLMRATLVGDEGGQATGLRLMDHQPERIRDAGED